MSESTEVAVGNKNKFLIITEIKIDDISYADRLRSEQSTRFIEESIQRDGLETPITVYQNPDFISEEETPEETRYLLIYGYHRLKSTLNLGWETIPCFIKEGIDQLEARRLEVIENLARNELTKAERMVHTAELVRIYNEQNDIRAGRPKLPESKSEETDDEKIEDDIEIDETSDTGDETDESKTSEPKTQDKDEPAEPEKPLKPDEQLAKDLNIGLSTARRLVTLGKRLSPEAISNIAQMPIADNASQLEVLSKFDKITQVALSKILREEYFDKGNKKITIYEANRIFNGDPINKPGKAVQSIQNKYSVLLDVLSEQAKPIGADWTKKVITLEKYLDEIDIEQSWQEANRLTHRKKLDAILETIEMVNKLVLQIEAIRDEYLKLEQ